LFSIGIKIVLTVNPRTNTLTENEARMVEVTPNSESINDVPGAGMEEANGLEKRLRLQRYNAYWQTIPQKRDNTNHPQYHPFALIREVPMESED
jgi:hypothetical protein